MLVCSDQTVDKLVSELNFQVCRKSAVRAYENKATESNKAYMHTKT